MSVDLLGEVVAAALAPVVVETPGGVPEHLADIAFVRDSLQVKAP